MPMSFDGHAASSSGCAIKPRARGTGLAGFGLRAGISLRTGCYAMATAEHREPCDSRGSCTVLGAPGGAIPLGDSTIRILEGRSEPNSVWSGLRHETANDVAPISHGRARCWLAHWPHNELTPWGLAK